MQCPAEAPYMHSDGLCYPEEEGQNNLNNGYNMEGGRRRSTRKSTRKSTTRKSRQERKNRQNVAARKNRQNTMRKNRRNGRKDRR